MHIFSKNWCDWESTDVLQCLSIRYRGNPFILRLPLYWYSVPSFFFKSKPHVWQKQVFTGRSPTLLVTDQNILPHIVMLAWYTYCSSVSVTSRCLSKQLTCCSKQCHMVCKWPQFLDIKHLRHVPVGSPPKGGAKYWVRKNLRHLTNILLYLGNSTWQTDSFFERSIAGHMHYIECWHCNSSDPNCPKSPLFLHFGSSFTYLEWVKLVSSNSV